jgi:hypothetical protein
VIILLIRFLLIRRKDIPAELFVAALRNENCGDFEAALTGYETALNEARKSRFNNGLENRINGKLKMLHTIIEYKKNFHFIR